MICAWSFATPIGAAPDEPAHIAQAVAIVRGQFDEPTHDTASRTNRQCPRPGWAAKNVVTCFQRIDQLVRQPHTGIGGRVSRHFERRDETRSCADPVLQLPTALLRRDRDSVVIPLRAIRALCNASGQLSPERCSRRTGHFAPYPLLPAPHPLGRGADRFVTDGALHDGSRELQWPRDLVWVRDVVWRPVYRRTPASSRVPWPSGQPSPQLCSSSADRRVRSTPPIITVVVALLIGWRGLRQRLNPSLVPLWSPVLVAVIVAGGFLAVVGPPPRILGVPPLHPASLLSNMWTTLRLTGVRLRQCIGDFGWLDTPVPTWVVIVWTSCVGRLDRLRPDALGTVSARPPRSGADYRRHAPRSGIASDQQRQSLVAGKVLAPGGGRVPLGGLDLPMAIAVGWAPQHRRTMGRPSPCARGRAGASRRPGSVLHTRSHALRGRPRCAGRITYSLVAARRP